MEREEILSEIIEELKVLEKERLNKQADDLIDNLIKIKENNSLIFVYGAGRSGFVGRGLVMRLVQAGFHAYFVGESATPPMNPEDLIILISGSGKTDMVRKTLTISKDNGLKIALITSHPKKTFKDIDQIIAVEGKIKTDNVDAISPVDSSLPLGSYFELNAFVFLECLMAKLIDKSPHARESIEEVGKKYGRNSLIVN